MKQKLRIVHIEDYFDPTAGYQINEMIKYNIDAEHIVITSFDMSPFHKNYSELDDARCEEKHGVKIKRLESRFKISQRISLKSWLYTAESYNPDVLFLHGIGDFKDLLLYKKKRSYLVVRDCHMSWIASRNPLASIYYWFFTLFFASIINSTKKYFKVYALGVEEKQYLKRIGVKNEKIDLLPHGYDPNQFYFSDLERKELRTKLGIKENEFVISYIGKHDKYKQPDLVFDCLEKVDFSSLNEKKIVLLFIGAKNDNYMSSVFNSKCEENKTRFKIIIEPSVDYVDLRGYYCASDICFWPKETTLSSIHAQACGTSVFMENHISNKERVIEMNNLYEINDIDDAAYKIEKMIETIKPNNKFLVEGVQYRDYSKMMKAVIASWKNSLVYE